MARSYDIRNADLLFQVVSRRYEKRSIVLTTNLTFGEWPSILPNAACTTALIDRLVHHSEIISIEGRRGGSLTSFPRQDGKHRLVSGTYKAFKADCLTVGITPQRQYESRASFRSLAKAGGASSDVLKMITHPKPVDGQEFYDRVRLMWSRMCEAILAIPVSAWDGTPVEVPWPSTTPTPPAPPSPPGSAKPAPPAQPEAASGASAAEVTAEVTFRVTVAGPTNEKPPTSLENVGGQMEREKGFEPSTLALARRCSTTELFPQGSREGPGYRGWPRGVSRAFPPPASGPR